MEKNKNLGILYIICSAFCFASMGLFVRLAGDIPSMQKSFFRNFIAFLFAAFIILRDKVDLRISGKSIFPLLMRSVMGTVGILANFYAVDHMRIADASMLNKLSPFFALIFSFFILKEAISLYQAVCIAIAFLGTLFVIKPSPELLQNPAALVGILGGMGAGIAYTFVRYLSKQNVPGPLIIGVFSLFSCLFTIPTMLFDYTPMTVSQTLSLLMAGVSAAGGQFAITAAYSHAPAREISVYDYTQIIFSTLLGFIFLHELPDGYSFVGYAIIIGASLAMFIMNNKAAHHS